MDNVKRGIISVLIAYTVWGFQPLYWKYLSHLDIEIVMAARIIWSFILCRIALAIRSRKKNAGAMAKMDWKERGILFFAAFMLGFNWMLNIYAANSGRVIEASLGHFITPVMTIFAGLLFFGERMRRNEKAGFVLVLSGGLYILLREGRLPLVAVFLVVSFLSYTVLKKYSKSGALEGFVTEMLYLLPFSLWIIFNKQGQWETLFSIRNSLLLFSTGIFTAIPMLLFSYGVKNIRLSRMGYIQYYAPTISFFLGVFIFREPFSAVRLTGFALIWMGAFAASAGHQVNELLNKYHKLQNNG